MAQRTTGFLATLSGFISGTIIVLTMAQQGWAITTADRAVSNLQAPNRRPAIIAPPSEDPIGDRAELYKKIAEDPTTIIDSVEWEAASADAVIDDGAPVNLDE